MVNELVSFIIFITGGVDTPMVAPPPPPSLLCCDGILSVASTDFSRSDKSASSLLGSRCTGALLLVLDVTAVLDCTGIRLFESSKLIPLKLNSDGSIRPRAVSLNEVPVELI